MFIATYILKMQEQAAWLKTPFQITKQYKLWKELTGRDGGGNTQAAAYETQDAIDIALGGL